MLHVFFPVHVLWQFLYQLYQSQIKQFNIAKRPILHGLTNVVNVHFLRIGSRILYNFGQKMFWLWDKWMGQTKSEHCPTQNVGCSQLLRKEKLSVITNHSQVHNNQILKSICFNNKETNIPLMKLKENIPWNKPNFMMKTVTFLTNAWNVTKIKP